MEAWEVPSGKVGNGFGFVYVVLKVHTFLNGPVAQLVRAPPCHGGGREFESLLGRCFRKETVNNGILAQLGEHLPYKQRVIGSSPIGPIYIMGDFPSGQRGQTVNLLAMPSVVRIHHRPFEMPMWLNWQSS